MRTTLDTHSPLHELETDQPSGLLGVDESTGCVRGISSVCDFFHWPPIFEVLFSLNVAIFGFLASRLRKDLDLYGLALELRNCCIHYAFFSGGWRLVAPALPYQEALGPVPDSFLRVHLRLLQQRSSRSRFFRPLT